MCLKLSLNINVTAINFLISEVSAKLRSFPRLMRLFTSSMAVYIQYGYRECGIRAQVLFDSAYGDMKKKPETNKKASSHA